MAYDPGSLGILYAEDFGRETPDDPIEAPAPDPVPPPPPPLTQADLDAACRHAVDAAEATWSARAEQRRADALATLADGLAATRDDAARHAETVAEGVARTALGLLAGMLPHFCRTHGEQEVRALLQHLVPLLATHSRLVIRVHPGLIDTIRTDLDTLDDSLSAQLELRPANLPPGDVRLTWEDGALTRDTAAMGAAMQLALAQLGLDLPPEHAADPSPIPESRSLAFAR